MKNISQSLTLAAMAAGVVGSVAHCIGASLAWVAVLACGLILFFARLNDRMRCDDFRVKRILSILMFSSVMLCVCAYLMMESKSYWVLPLLISACVELYATFRVK